MATKNGGKIQFQVDLAVNKSGLNELTKSLQNVQNQLKTDPAKGLDAEFQKAASAAKELQGIINSSWNTKLNQLNLDKFNQGVKKAFTDVNGLKTALVGGGAAGQTAFNQIATSVLNTNIQLRQSNKLLDSMATSMSNTVKWGITSSIFNKMTGSIQQAYYFAKDLDTSLTNIRIVTGDSADEMERFAKTANTAAQQLGRSTLDYTNAALTFYQQGLDEQAVQARTESTLKAQNITGAGKEMADYLTAVWNGYQVANQQAELYVDKLAAVADSSASNMSQIAIAMSKVASTANSLGVDVDQLNAQIATIVATTRQAPESVGTALKTIYARINDIKTGSDDAQVSLGNYSGAMAKLGINVLDANGKLRDTGQVMEQIGGQWGNMSREQQIYLARTMAGARQYNNMIALFDNWTTYSNMLNVSLEAQGTLNEKNDRYLESVSAHTEQYNAELERTYSILADTGAINTVLDTMRGLVSTFNDFIEGIGGGINTFVYFGSIVTNIFSKQISNAILQAKQNLETLISNKNIQILKQEFADNILASRVASGSYDSVAQQASAKAAQKEAQIYKQILKVKSGLTQQTYNELMLQQQKIGANTQQIELIKNYQTIFDEVTGKEYTSYQEILDTVYERKQALEDEEKIQQEVLNEVREYLGLVQNGFTPYVENQDVLEHILDLSQNINFSVQERTQLQSIYNKMLNNEQLDNEDLKFIYEIINKQIQRKKQLLQQAQEAQKRGKQYVEGQAKVYEEQNKTLEKNIKLQTERAAQAQKTQNIIRQSSLAVRSVSSILGSIVEFTKEEATAAEKANAAWSGIQGALPGVAGMIANHIVPGSGLIVSTLASGLLGIGKSILQLTGLWDKFENSLMSAEERLEKIKEIQKETTETSQTYRSNRKEIEEFATEWERLSKKSSVFTEEQQTRYNELAEILAKYNADIITGYDNRGNAIVKNNEAISDTLKILDEEYEKTMRNMYAGENLIAIKNSDSGYQTAKEKVENAQEDIDSENYLDFNYLQSQIQGKLNSSENSVFRSVLDLIEAGHSKIGPKLQDAVNDLNNNIVDAGKDYNEILTLLKTQWSDNEGSIKELLNHLSESDVSEGAKVAIQEYFESMIEVAENFVEEEEKAQQKLSNAKRQLEENKTINVTDFFNVLRYSEEINEVTGESYNQQYNDLKNIFGEYWDDFGEQIINSLLETELSSLKYGDNGESFDQVAAVAQEWLQGLLNQGFNFKELNNYVTKKVNLDAKSINISIDEYEKQLQSLIQQTINKTGLKKFLESGDQEQINWASLLLNELFDVSNLKFEGSTLVNFVSSFQDKISQALNEIGGYHYEGSFLESWGLNDSEKEKIQSWLKSFSNTDEALEFIQVLKTIGITGVKTADELIEKAKEYKNEADMSQVNLSWDDQLKLAEALEKDKSIAKIQGGQQYIQALIDTQPELRQAATKNGGIYSEQFVKAYKEYITKQKQQMVDAARINYEQAQNAFNAVSNLDPEDQRYKEAQTILANALWNLVQAESDLKRATEETNKELKTQAELAKEQSTKDYTNYTKAYSQGKSALANAQSGKAYTDSDLQGLYLLEQQYSELASIENKNSQQYIDKLKEILELHKEDFETQKEAYVESLQARKEQIDAEIKSDSAKLDRIKQIQKEKENASLEDKDRLALEKEEETLRNNISLTEDEINAKKEQSASLDLLIYQTQHSTLEDTKQIVDIYAEGLNGLNSFNDLMQKAQENQHFSTDELTKLKQLTDVLKNDYPELARDIELLGKAQLSNTQAYEKAAERVHNALLNFNISQIEQQVKKSYQEMQSFFDQEFVVKINADQIDKYIANFEDYLQHDYQIDLLINSDIKTQFDDIITRMQQIESAAGKIGQGFIIAAKDAEVLAEVFPGILDGHQLLADGTIQLNQDIAKSAVDTAKTEVEADGQSVKERLNDQADYLEAKAAVYQELAESAYKLAEDEMISQSSVDAWHVQEAQKLAEFDKANSRDVAINEMQTSTDAKNSVIEDQAAIANSSQINFGNVSTNAARAGTAIAQAMAQAGRSAVESLSSMAAAVRAAINGDQISYRSGALGVNSHYQGIAGSTSGKTSGGSAGLSSLINTISQGVSNAFQRSKDTISRALGMDDVRATLQKEMRAIGDRYSSMAKSLTESAQSARGLANSVDANLNNLNNIANNIGKNKASSGKGTKGGSGKSKASGGDQLTSGDQKQIDEIQYVEEEYDIYHDINVILQKINTQLERAKKLQSKLIGKDVVAGYNKQLEILNKQVERQEQKLNLANDEAAALKKYLKNYGVIFNPDNTIGNYNSALQQQLKFLNDRIYLYNQTGMDMYKEQVQKQKAVYQEFKKNLERYDELASKTIDEIQDSITDSINEQIALNVAKFDLTIQVDLDLANAEREWNDFQKKIIKRIRDNDVFGNDQYLLKNLGEYYQKDIPSLTTGVTTILNELQLMDQGIASSIYGDDRATALEDLQKRQKELMQALTASDDIVDNIKNSIFDIIDQAQEAFDTQVKEYDFISDLINHDAKMVQLIYGDDAYKSMSRYFKQAQTNNLKEIKFLRQEKDLWYQKMQAEQKRMNSLPEGSENWEDANKRFEEYKNHWMDAVSKLNSTVQSATQNLINSYSNTINQIFAKLQDKMTNGMGMSTVKEEWELVNKEADTYIDKINAINDIQQIENAYRQAIDANAGNAAVQKSLNDMMEEQLKMLKDKQKLSQYDIDRAKALLDIEVKRLALENARGNKSKLRLRRDSQGNYSYQYVADQSETGKAQEELNKARNDLYNMTRDAYQDNLGDYYSAVEEWQGKIKEVYLDTTLTAEEQQQKQAMLNEYYGNIINNLTQQNESLKKYLVTDTFNEITRLYGIDADNYKKLVEEEYDEYKKALEDYQKLVAEKQSALETIYKDNTLSTIEQQAKIAEVNEHYNTLLNESNAHVAEMREKVTQDNFETLARLYGGDVADFIESLNIKQQKEEDHFKDLETMTADYMYAIKAVRADDQLSEKEKQKEIARLTQEYQKQITQTIEEQQRQRLSSASNTLQQLSEVFGTDLETVMQNSNDERKAFLDSLGDHEGFVKDYSSRVAQIMSDTTLTARQQQQAIEALNKEYGPKINKVVKDNDDALLKLKDDTFANMSGKYDADVEAFKDMNIKEEGLMGQTTKTWDTGIQSMIDKVIKQDGLQGSVDAGLLKIKENVTNENEGFAATFGNEAEGAVNQTDEKFNDEYKGFAAVIEKGVNAASDKFNNSESGFGKVVSETLQQADASGVTYQQSLNTLAVNAGTNLRAIETGYDKDKEAADKLLDSNKQLINQWSDSTTTVQNTIDQLDDMKTKYDGIYTSATSATQAVKNYIAAVKEQQGMAAKQKSAETKVTSINMNKNKIENEGEVAAAAPAQELTGVSDILSSGLTVSKTSTNIQNSKKSKTTTSSTKSGWNAVMEVYNKINSGQWKVNGLDARIKKGISQGYSEKTVRDAQSLINYMYSTSLKGSNTGSHSLEAGKKMLGYQTGGYTGSWNSNNGKLAILHEKELVLNKEDTKNILDAVAIVRTVNDVISSFGGIASLPSFIHNVANNNNTNQNVSITANFPAATNRDEIEAALSNLVNRASQYVSTGRY